MNIAHNHVYLLLVSMLLFLISIFIFNYFFSIFFPSIPLTFVHHPSDYFLSSPFPLCVCVYPSATFACVVPVAASSCAPSSSIPILLLLPLSEITLCHLSIILCHGSGHSTPFSLSQPALCSVRVCLQTVAASRSSKFQ